MLSAVLGDAVPPVEQAARTSTSTARRALHRKCLTIQYSSICSGQREILATPERWGAS